MFHKRLVIVMTHEKWMIWEGGSIETGVEFSVSDGNLYFRTDPNGFD